MGCGGQPGSFLDGWVGRRHSMAPFGSCGEGWAGTAGSMNPLYACPAAWVARAKLVQWVLFTLHTLPRQTNTPGTSKQRYAAAREPDSKGLMTELAPRLGVSHLCCKDADWITGLYYKLHDCALNYPGSAHYLL